MVVMRAMQRTVHCLLVGLPAKQARSAALVAAAAVPIAAMRDRPAESNVSAAGRRGISRANARGRQMAFRAQASELDDKRFATSASFS